MTKDQIIAQALVCWIDEKIKQENDIAGVGLPYMDVQHFFMALSQIEGFEPEQFSIALAGYGTEATELRRYANQAGLNDLQEIADDFHTAGSWRNLRSSHPRIIALARGRQPGVHTLKHFTSPNSRELARIALEWAYSSSLYPNIPIQRTLLHILANSPHLDFVRSFESVSEFLASWLKHLGNPNDAPRKALPELGLLSDSNLFNDVESRLIKNIDVTSQVLDAQPTQIKKIRDRVSRFTNIAIREELISILNRVEALRMMPTLENRSSLTIDDVEKIFRPKDLPQHQDPPEEDPDIEDEQDNNEETEHGSYNSKGITRHSANALLDDNQEEIETIIEAIESSWNHAAEEGQSNIEGEIRSDNQVYSFNFQLDTSFLNWLHTFCTKNIWGGIIYSKEPSLELAIKNHINSVKQPVILTPEEIIKQDGNPVSMVSMFSAFDDAFLRQEGKELNLSALWHEFTEHRSKLIEHLDYLVHFPLIWMSGKPDICSTVDRYLRVGSSLYRVVQENYRIMSDLSEGYARAILEGLLALDVFQVRLHLDGNRIAYKAILLPTHPLHLWRYQRLASILRGLGTQVSGADREAILKDVSRPEYFSSVLWLGSIPSGHGVDQILPISNQLHGLATFENLKNAISGIDGVEELTKAVDYFTILSRHHARPLRLTLINPPEPGKILTKLVGVLNKRRESTLPYLRVEMYFTNEHSYRKKLAMRLSDEREVLEDKISSGRLQLKIIEQLYDQENLIQELRERPCHILALFDEASVRIRRSSLGRMLPMSPFCVRRQIRPDIIRNEIQLEPTSDEPPFSEYMQLINEAQRGQRDSTPHAWADAENLRTLIDEFLQGDFPAAHWVYLADRALPSEGGMRSVRLIRKVEGQRQVLLAASDYRFLVIKIREVFERNNLSLTSDQLENLLEEGVGLLGEGFLNLIRSKDGRPDPSRVRGLAGMLLAARDYKQRYPECLLVAVDSELARLWLRLGRKTYERCDLLALRMDEGAFVIESIEVKTTQADSLSDRNIINHAYEQIQGTLDACASALPDHISGQNPLSAPRCEMLKEIFVTACQSRTVEPELRSKWGTWLRLLFNEVDATTPITVSYVGEVIQVLLGSNEQLNSSILSRDPFLIKMRQITESRIQDLLENISPLPDQSQQKQENLNLETGNNSNIVCIDSYQNQDLNDRYQTNFWVESIASDPQLENYNFNDPAVQSCTSDSAGTQWPPQLNALGMVGQDHTVLQLINQVRFSRASGRRFSDKLLVGPAGVGKSSLARAIARQLLGQEEILFNGADLNNAKILTTVLKDQNIIPQKPSGTVQVKECLIFIDEVHAIKGVVANTLLGAMDDARVTTIEGVNYDFSNVVFILATTDPGKLSEAFISRPDKIYLRPYSLNELAAIVWLHGKDNLGGHELAYDTCVEIAARTRCQPRRAVRTLTQSLIPYFYGLTHVEEQGVDYSRIAASLTSSAVAQWFEEQGVDLNGLDSHSRNYLNYLRRHGATSRERLQQALGITNKGDFVEVTEYLMRLLLINISAAGCTLTRDGVRYIDQPADLRDRISRQQID